MLATERLLTLVGPGVGPAGCGKTRLALEAARDALAGFADGVHPVQLAATASPERVASAVARALALGGPTAAGRPSVPARQEAARPELLARLRFKLIFAKGLPVALAPRGRPSPRPHPLASQGPSAPAESAWHCEMQVQGSVAGARQLRAPRCRVRGRGAGPPARLSTAAGPGDQPCAARRRGGCAAARLRRCAPPAR